MFMRRHRLFQLLSATVMVAGMGAALVLCDRLITRERAELQRNAELDAQRIAARVQAGVMSGVPPLSALGAWWLSQGKPLDREDWRTDGQLFLARSTGLLQAAWISSNGFQEWSAKPAAEPRLKRGPPDIRLQRLIPATAYTCSPAISA